MVKQLYSTLNIFYLKLFQYEKYLNPEAINRLRLFVNQELDQLREEYSTSHKLLKMTLKDFQNNCTINPNFDHKLDIETMEKTIELEMNAIPVLGYSFLRIYKETILEPNNPQIPSLSVSVS